MKSSPPPRQIPKELVSEFTMNGKCRVVMCYSDDSSNKEEKNKQRFTKDIFNKFLSNIKNKGCSAYGITDTWLYSCLDKYSIKDKSVVIIGSEKPWYEGICLHYGCKDITTIEYNKITFDHPNIKFMTPEEYEKNPRTFDIGISISSFEHDGLGRYGDPIDPQGDLKIMKKMKKIIKPDGLLILAIPIGLDSIFWNVHRVYGAHRLPLMLEGWKKIDSFGYSDGLLKQTRAHIQPVFVLKNI